MRKVSIKFVLFSALVLGLFSYIETSKACSRVVYHGENGMFITARSMDWSGEIPANLWILPRGIERNGLAGSNSVKWISKYGSVVASSWDITSSDGMNEKGLVGNLLWLAESKYPEFKKDGDRTGLAISLWLQYTLDNFATVDEAVKALEKEEFVVVSGQLPNSDTYANIHLSLSDANGDNAIFEYIDGKLNIYHNSEYLVMTNSPTYDKQLAINSYWKDIPGKIMLPGTNRATDRFVRASYYINAIPKTDDARIAVASVFSVIRNCSVPYGIFTKNQPNISSTRWRTVADQKNLVYYFENFLTPNVIWVDFKNVDFNEKASVKKLKLDNNETYVGENSKNFAQTEPFQFFGL